MIYCSLLFFSLQVAPLTPIPMVECGAHTAQVTDLAVSQDGSFLVSVGYDKVARIRDVSSGASGGVLRGPIGLDRNGWLFAVALIERGGRRLAAIAGQDVASVQYVESGVEFEPEVINRIRIFDVESGEIVQTLDGHLTSISSLSSSPNGKLLASADFHSKKPKVIVWDLDSGKPAKVFEDHAGSVRTVRFSPDGAWLASAGDDQKVLLYDTATWKKQVWHTAKGRILRMEWSPDSTRIAIGDLTSSVQVKSLPPESKTVVFDGQVFPAGIAFSADSKSVYVTGNPQPKSLDCPIHLFDAASGKRRRLLDGPTSPITVLRTSLDGGRLIFGSINGAVESLPLERLEPWKSRGGAMPVAQIGIGPNMTIAWKTFEKQPKLLGFDLAASLPIENPTESSFQWVRAIGSSEGPATVSQEGNTLFMTRSGATRISINVSRRDPYERPLSAALSQGNKVVVGTNFGAALFNDRGDRLVDLVGHNGAVNAVGAFDDWIITGGADQTIRVWNARATPSRIGFFEKAIAPVFSLFQTSNSNWVAWHPDGYYASSPNGDAYMGWHVNRGENRAGLFHFAEQFRNRFYSPSFLRRAVAFSSQPPTDLHALLASVGAAAVVEDTLPKVAAELPTVHQIVIEKTGEDQKIEIIPPTDERSKDHRIVSAGQLATTVVTNQTQVLVVIRFRAPSLVDLGLRLNIGRVAYDFILTAANVKIVGDYFQFETQVTLPEGNVVLSAALKSSGVVSAPKGQSIKFIDERDDLPPGKLLVTAFGVSHYDEISDLRYAHLDANRFVEFYKSAGFSDPDHKVWSSIVERAVTRNSVIGRLAEVSNAAQPNDTIAILISGHGIVVEDRNSKVSKYLMTVASLSKADPMRDGIAWSDIVQTLAKAKAKNIVLFIDACRSGEISEELRRSQQESLNASIGEASNWEHSFIVFASCGAAQESYESKEEEFGIFTGALIGSLKSMLADDAVRDLYTLTVETESRVSAYRARRNRATPRETIHQKPELHIPISWIIYGIEKLEPLTRIPILGNRREWSTNLKQVPWEESFEAPGRSRFEPR